MGLIRLLWGGYLDCVCGYVETIVGYWNTLVMDGFGRVDDRFGCSSTSGYDWEVYF